MMVMVVCRGASNLYEMYLRGMSDIIDLEWDYFHNLSESDLPVKPIDQVLLSLRIAPGTESVDCPELGVAVSMLVMVMVMVMVLVMV